MMSMTASKKQNNGADFGKTSSFNQTQGGSGATNPASLKGKLMGLEVKKI